MAQDNNSSSMSFGQFYAGIRAHFSGNTWEYSKFKQCRGVHDKLRFLLEHAAVRKSLESLAAANTQVPLGCIFGTPQSENRAPIQVEQQKKVTMMMGSAKFPQMSKKVEVKSSKKKGRHLVAKDRINAGEILIYEQPHSTVLYREHFGTHCTNCFRRLPKTKKWSCQHCNEVNYCSETCKSFNYDLFHWAECGLLERLLDQDIGRLALLVYRLVVKTGLDTCLETLKADLTKMEKDAVYDSCDYRAAFLQVTHEELRDPGDLFKRSAIALYLVHHLRLGGFFPDQDAKFFRADNEKMVGVAQIIVGHLQSCSCNAYEIGELVRGFGTGLPDCNIELGGAVYTNVSLSNHSCAPNTIRGNVGSTCIVRSACTIRKGEEVTDNYGHFFQIKPRDERQNVLKTQYFFDCECVACKNDWPTFHDLRAAGKKGATTTTLICAGCRTPVPISQVFKLKKCTKCKKELKLSKLAKLINSFGDDVQRALQSMDATTVDQHLAHFLAILNLMESNVSHPCADYITCQQVISQCYALSGNVSNVSES